MQLSALGWGWRAVGGAMALALPNVAHAAAWMNPNQTIITGLLRDDGGGAQGEVDQYLERQVSSRFAIVARSYGASQSDFAAPGQRAWAGQAQVAGKLALHSGARTVAAMELGPVYSSEANPSCTGWGGELRGAGGRELGARLRQR